VTLYRRACDEDHAAACRKLGRLHLKGDGVDRIPTKAKELFARACALGDEAGCDYGGKLAK
jgi:TPR repeat protein